MVFSKFFGANKIPVVGVDIAQDCLTIAKIKKTDDTYVIDILERRPIPEDSFMNGVVVKSDEIGEMISGIFQELNIGDFRVNFSIPANIPFIRTLTLPDIPFEELKQIALDESTNILPFSIDNANIDLVLLDETRRVQDGTKRVVDVLLIAVTKNIIQSYIDVADVAKFRLNSIDISSYSMIKGLAHSGQIKEGKEIYVSTMIGYDYTDISIVSNGMPVFSHITPIGKKNLLETISSGLGVEISEIENLIPEISILVPGYPSSDDPKIVKASQLARMIYNSISTEISKAIQFYQSQKTDAPEIQKVIVGGSGACVKNAEKFISNRLKIETEFANVFMNLNVNERKLEDWEVPTFVTAIGLGLKGL